MKTLIFNGSPRKKGDTVTLINEMLKNINGEYIVISGYFDDIAPCNDCRYCYTNKGCSIKDKMGEVYDYLEICDNVIIASPIYFSELTGPLLSVMSRLQTYFCSRSLRKEEMTMKEKSGGIILVGGGDGKIEGALRTAKILLRHMNVKEYLDPVVSHNTNNVSAKEDIKALENIRKMAKELNEINL